jgi:hypothetical protein
MYLGFVRLTDREIPNSNIKGILSSFSGGGWATLTRALTRKGLSTHPCNANCPGLRSLQPIPFGLRLQIIQPIDCHECGRYCSKRVSRAEGFSRTPHGPNRNSGFNPHKETKYHTPGNGAGSGDCRRLWRDPALICSISRFSLLGQDNPFTTWTSHSLSELKISIY